MSIGAVAYLRVSTDDRGQDPERQLITIRPWCEREGVDLLDVIPDEGTSATRTNPFQRPRFIIACERAKSLGATAIVVEVTDRWGRQGSKEDAWAEVELRRRYNLALYRADKSVSQHGTMIGNTIDALKAEGAHEWVSEHRRKVKTGMENAMKKGIHVGRPPKELTEEELALVTEMRSAGTGWRRIAHVISKGRGAFDVADPKKRRERSVTHMLLKRRVTSGAGVTKLEA